MSSRDPALLTSPCLQTTPPPVVIQKIVSSKKRSMSAEELWAMVERNLGRKLVKVPSGVERLTR